MRKTAHRREAPCDGCVFNVLSAGRGYACPCDRVVVGRCRDITVRRQGNHDESFRRQDGL